MKIQLFILTFEKFSNYKNVNVQKIILLSKQINLKLI